MTTFPDAIPLQDYEAKLFDMVADAIRQDVAGFVNVFRATPGRGRSWLGKVQLADFDRDFLRAKWGGGRYCCQLSVGGKLGAAATFDIEPPPAAPDSPDPTPVAAARAPEIAGEPVMVAFLREELRASRELTNTLLAKLAQPQTGDRELLIQAMQANSGPGVFQKAMETVVTLQSTLGGGDRGGDSSGLESIIERVLVRLMDRSRPAASQQALPTAAAARPAQVVGTQQASGQDLASLDELLGLPVSGYVQHIRHAIATDLDPEACGVILFRHTTRGLERGTLTQEQVAHLDAVDPDTTGAALAKRVPDLAGRGVYIAAALDAFLGILDEWNEQQAAASDVADNIAPAPAAATPVEPSSTAAAKKAKKGGES